jgi:hypothetical protein
VVLLKKIVGNIPPNLEELKEQVNSGYYEFIEKLMYFRKNIPGSSSYWRSKSLNYILG